MARQETVDRFYWVDALRGVAALVIVVFHYHHFYLADAFDRPSIPPKDSFPYASLLQPLYSSAAAKAVELFWLISGFVFAHVYLPRRVSAWSFSVARFARLYPLHFVTLLYVAGLQAISLNAAGHWQVYGNNDGLHFALQFFMASNWVTWSHGLSFNGPIWSVSIEIVVYGIFFVALFWLRKAPLVLPLVLLVAAWGWVTLEPVKLPVVQIMVFRCVGYFFLGSLLYSLRPHANLTRAALLTASGVAITFVGVGIDAHHVIVSGVAVAMLSVAAGLDRAAPALGARLGSLGDISYSVYLVHVPLQMTALLIADLAFDGTRGFADSYLTLPIYVIFAVALAYAAHIWFERPVGKALRSKLLRRT